MHPSQSSRSGPTGVPNSSLSLLERETPLASLNAALKSAHAGQGQTVIVGGEAGIGKTSLLRAFAQALAGEKRNEPAKLLWGGSDALFTPQPLGPLKDMADNIDPRLAALLDDMAPQDRIFPALLNALQSGPETRVLIFEDVHWADNATFDLIKYIGRRIAFVRAVLVLSYRSDEVGANHPLSQVLGDLPASSTKRIALKPLSAEGVATLARASGQDGLELYRITMGNPFFATELLASTQPHGQRNPEKGVPASVRDAVWARLQRLPPKERALLEAVSVAPSGAENWLAEALIGENADAAIDACVARNLLVKDSEDRYRFRHELARAATLDRLPPATQRHLHRLAFEMLAKRPSFPLACLTHHAAGAGDWENVLALAPRAAAEAIKLGAHREAATHLATALRQASEAPPELAARLHEDWAYEASLTLHISDEILAAAAKAIALWRGLSRKDKVSHNLRRLSRFHWYRGESPLAIKNADEAIATLDGEPQSRELALAYSNRAQLYMFNDHFDQAIDLSRKAIALATDLGDVETRIHALNNLGGSQLFAGRAEGKAAMEESLALSLAHGFTDQANRAYMNFGEYAILAKEFDLAERLLAEGMAFNSKHDLDANIHLLAGRQAQLRMEQGRFEEAETIASSILGLEDLALVVKLPARFVLARTRLRLGKDDGQALIRQALSDAVATDELQHILPAHLAMIEAYWLEGDLASARAELKAMSEKHLGGLDSWDMGAFAVWWRRCGMEAMFPHSGSSIAVPREAELRGEAQSAAGEWTRLGLPYEAALALLANPEGLARAVLLLDELGARPAASLARRMAKDQGVTLKAANPKRGPYAAAKRHPLGLTSREAEVLELIVEGLGNQEIAARLTRSPRTVEHHVSALLGKLNATSRMDVLLRLRNEPWLVPGGVREG